METKRKMIGYKIVAEENTKALNDKVTTLLVDGWELHDHRLSKQDIGFSVLWHQIVVKYE